MEIPTTITNIDDVLVAFEEVKPTQGEAPQSTSQIPKKRKKKRKSPQAVANDKATQSFFRITTNKQMNQISQVDYKANVLVTLFSLIASVIVGLFMAHYDLNSIYALPVVVLAVGGIISVFFALLVVVSPSCSECQAGQKHVNVMNFNQFSKLSLQRYKEELNKTISNEADIYETLTEDLYKTGTILKKKFFYLNLAYKIFFLGVFSAILLGIALQLVF